jgi:hypothetical protein
MDPGTDSFAAVRVGILTILMPVRDTDEQGGERDES